MTHPILTTQRLVLTPMSLADAPDMVRLNSDPEVTRFTGDGPFSSLDQAEALVKGYDQYTRFGTGRLICRLVSDGSFLGFCGLRTDPDTNVVDLGFRLSKRWWGMGFAREASEVCINYGFDTLGLSLITARAMPENLASTGLLGRLSFIEVGTEEEDGASWVCFELAAFDWRSLGLER